VVPLSNLSARVGLSRHGIHYVTTSAYRIEQGAAAIGRYQPTPFGERTFCPGCGVPLKIHGQHQSKEIDIAVGSLADPNAAAPGVSYIGRSSDSVVVAVG
jgi:hypothetical protein